MFEHLDDPAPFRPDPGLRRRAVERGRRLRLRRRLAATAGATTLALGSVALAGVAYVERRDDAIDRIDIATAPSLDEATNILLVGTDGRPGIEEGVRTDTIALLRLRPDGTVGLLSLPRDLLVPGTGQRLNAAFATGGAQGVIDTLSASFALPVDHLVQVDFAGFVGLVDAAGGLPVAVDVPLRDEPTGLDLAPAACTTLDGEAALALVRARRIDGDPSGDLGRMARTRVVLVAALGRLAETVNDPGELNRLVDLLAEHATLDAGLTLGALVELGRDLGHAGPSALSAPDLPVAPVTTDGGEFLQLGRGADAVLQEFGATGPPPEAVTPAAGGATAPPGELPAPGIHPC